MPSGHGCPTGEIFSEKEINFCLDRSEENINRHWMKKTEATQFMLKTPWLAAFLVLIHRPATWATVIIWQMTDHILCC